MHKTETSSAASPESEVGSKLEPNVLSEPESKPQSKLESKVELEAVMETQTKLDSEFEENFIKPLIPDSGVGNWAEIWAAAGAAVAKEKPAQLPGRRLAQRELSDVLELHHRWLVSNEANGEQADLAGAQLQSADLTGADLRRAILHKANLENAELFMADCQNASLAQANLANANLLGTQFQRADLQGAKLDGVIGLQMNQLAGADLRGATLPSSLSESAAIARVRQLSNSALAMLAAMLSVCVLACVRIFTATDAQLVRNSSVWPLLHLGNAVPMTAFFLMTPVLLLGLCIATHLRLFRLWEAVEASPEIFPSGKRLTDCGPWIVMALGFGQFEWLRGHRVALSWLEAVIASFMAYWIPPLVLIAFWARYLTLQDLHGAILDVLLAVFAIGLGAILPSLNARKLFRRTPLAESAKSLLTDPFLRPRAALALGIGLSLSLLSLGVVFGDSRAHTGSTQQNATGVANWATDILWLAHIDPYANLSQQSVSTTLAHSLSNSNGATENGEDELLALTQGAVLRGRNLRHAQAYRAFLAKADLWDANLESADLSEADLRLADLHRSSLRGALLNHAQLSRANMEGSDLTGAALFEANLSQANLSSASLSDAILNGANFESANLYGADLHSSQLSDANFKRADLRSANLGQTKLPDALLQDSYLSSAKFFSADLRRAHLEHAFLTQADLREANMHGADLQGATLTDADLHGANLEGADLRGASGIAVAQICSARFNGETQFDDALALQVAVSCPQK